MKLRKERENIKNFLFTLVLVAFLLVTPLAHAQFMQNYDELHEAYAVSSCLHPGTPSISLYIQKIFPMDGSPIFYTFAAYDSTWRNLFTVDSSVTFLIDGQSFSPNARLFSRQLRTFPTVHNASRVEFILSDALIASLSYAQEVSIISADGKINYELPPEEIDELKNIINQNHY